MEDSHFTTLWWPLPHVMFLISKASERLKEAQTVFEAVNRMQEGKGQNGSGSGRGSQHWLASLCWQLRDLVPGGRPAPSLRAFSHLSLREEPVGWSHREAQRRMGLGRRKKPVNEVDRKEMASYRG